MHPTSLFFEKKNEDGYVYIFVATDFKNGMVTGKTYKPILDEGVYMFEEEVTRNIQSSTLNFDLICSDNLRNNDIKVKKLFANPYMKDVIH